MNILIITLGNSEIQFNEDELGSFRLQNNDKILTLTDGNISISVRKNIRNGKSQWLMPVSSRDDGEVILNNFDVVKSIVHFPIIEPLFEFIRENQIEKFYLVVTNQEDIVHRKGDTINYGYIIKKYFLETLNLDEDKFSIIEITKNVRDIDYQYNNFKKILPELLGETRSDTEIKLHLLAQGGIDQINHALTLQLLRKYKTNVHVYQKAEDEELKEIHFPQLFLKDLNREKIIKHLEDYDFGKAGELMIDDLVISQLCTYLNYRLQLKTELASLMSNNFGKKFKNLLGQELTEKLILKWETLTYLEKNRLKIQDLIYSIRIDIYQNQFNQALIKLFTLFENLFKFKVEEYIRPKKDLKDLHNGKNNPADQNPKWIAFLKQIDSTLPDLLINMDIYVNNPNRRAYFGIYSFLTKNENDAEILNNLNSLIETMAGRRNGIAHNLGSVNKNDFNNLFVNSNISYEEFNQLTDRLIGTNSIGLFEEIRSKLLKIYSE